MRELPFVLPVPDSAAEFAALVHGRSAAELAEAISRIRKCNHPNLATGNRERLQVPSVSRQPWKTSDGLAALTTACRRSTGATGESGAALL